MCGIFGYIGSVGYQKALSCVAQLAHRGPDAQGLWHQPEVTLGHRRLSILDLSEQANQPMSYADERYWITFNGEIYNFLELRQQLMAKGYKFHSESDTEVILASFVEWGEDCLHRFNGMWAFGIWDTLTKELFLSRDRFGKKPLFYTVFANGDFAFASEMKALLPLLPTVSPNVSLIRSLVDIPAIISYETTEQCLIENIVRFPAGSYGRLAQGKLQLSRWWATLDHLMDIPRSYKKQVDMFQELFLDSCRLRMRSDVPTGTALSGGLDSSSTISAMAYINRTHLGNRIHRDWQHAFVASFPGTDLDETSYAKMVTEHLGIEATYIPIDPLETLDHLNDYFYLFEDIYVTPPIPFMLTYQAIKKHGIKVTLDGHGADELFGGYSYNVGMAIQDAGSNVLHAITVFQTLKKCRAYYYDTPEMTKHFRLRSQLTPWLKQALKRWKDCLSWENRPNIDPNMQCSDASSPHWKTLGHLNQSLYIATHEHSLPTLLRNYDRYSMANGVEIRMPFMDHRIVSFAFSLPWKAKVRRGYSKAIVRDAMAEFMPREVAYRQSKVGFSSPLVDWTKGPLKAYCLDIIHSTSFKTCTLFDPDTVAQAIREVIENPHATFADGERAWTLLTPYLWEQAMINRRIHG